MKVETKHFGELDVEEKDIIFFENGLIGFDELKRFVILLPESDIPFRWFQSLETPDIAFVIINPLLILSDYKVKITKVDMASLQADSIDDLEIYSIVTIPDNINEMTINLIGPIILNSLKGTAKQIIIDNSNYGIKYSLINALY